MVYCKAAKIKGGNPSRSNRVLSPFPRAKQIQATIFQQAPMKDGLDLNMEVFLPQYLKKQTKCKSKTKRRLVLHKTIRHTKKVFYICSLSMSSMFSLLMFAFFASFSSISASSDSHTQEQPKDITIEVTNPDDDSAQQAEKEKETKQQN